jgi:hypothetical protein
MDEPTLAYDCPRCGRAAEGRFWGPCAACRDDLAALLEREGRDVGAGAYEPKMHVVPNQVATKE